MEDYVMKIIISGVSVLLIQFWMFLSCPWEIHEKSTVCVCARAPVCVLAFEHVSAPVRGVNRWLSDSLHLTERMSVWVCVCVCLYGCVCVTVWKLWYLKKKVQKHWHYCICLISCVFSSILFLFVFFFLPNAIREIVFVFKTKQPTDGISIKDAKSYHTKLSWNSVLQTR